MNNRVFVYGTLMSGFGNNRLMQGRLVGRATTAGMLYNLNGFPGLRQDDGHGTVYGEVWDIDDASLAALDRLEGVAVGLYDRIRVVANVERHGSVEAWAYQISQRHTVGRQLVPNGDWAGMRGDSDDAA